MREKIIGLLLAIVTIVFSACGGNDGDSPNNGGGGGSTQIPTLPTAPTNLSASASASDSVHLVWVDSSNNESGFHIYRLPEKAIPAKSVPANTNNANITGLIAETNYQFQVSAYNSAGESTASNIASATTLAPPGPVPNPASNLQVQPFSSSEAYLSWSDNSNDEDAFRIYRGNSSTTINSQVGSVNADTTSYIDSGIVTGQAYYYLVKAHSAGGESNSSNVANVTTASPVARWEFKLFPYTNCAPYGPRTYAVFGWGTITEDEPRKIVLHTDMGNLTGAYAYQGIYHTQLSGTLNIPGIGLVTFNPLLLQAQLDWSSVIQSTGTVIINNCVGVNSSAAFRRIDPGAPDAPAQLTATSLNSSLISLNWVDTSDNELGFRIYRGTSLSSISDLVVTLGTDATGFLDQGLPASTSYVYQVLAYNASGESARSNYIGATTLAAPTAIPTAPSNLVAQAVNGTTVKLTWVDNADNEDGYRLYRGTSNANITTLVTTTNPGVVEYQNSNLTQGTSYYYQVLGFNTIGASARSNIATVTTPSNEPPPSAPTGLTATTVSDSEILLSWTDNANNELGFNVYQATGSCSNSFVYLGAIAANLNSQSIVQLSQATTYCYKINAYNTVGVSGFSNTASATTAANPPVLKIVNDLYNIDSGQYLWSMWNEVAYVRIGPYYDVINAQCNSVINNNNYERLNPISIGSLPGPVINPGYTATPTRQTYEDFDVSNFTSGNYCVFIQAGWWEYQVDIFGGGPGWWEIHPSSAINCAGQDVYGSKYSTFYIRDHTAGTMTVKVSDWLPHFQWQGSSFCQ